MGVIIEGTKGKINVASTYALTLQPHFLTSKTKVYRVRRNTLRVPDGEIVAHYRIWWKHVLLVWLYRIQNLKFSFLSLLGPPPSYRVCFDGNLRSEAMTYRDQEFLGEIQII